MNIVLTVAVYIAFVVIEYRVLRKKLTRVAKLIYFTLSAIAVISAIPASVGMNFETVGSSLSGMISLFMH